MQRQNTSVANITVTQIWADFVSFDIEVFCSFLVSPNAFDETTQVIPHVRLAKLGHTYADERDSDWVHASHSITDKRCQTGKMGTWSTYANSS